MNTDKNKLKGKVARKSIKLSLITELKTVVSKLGPLTGAVEKKIKKSAGDIAKKVTKEMVLNETALPLPNIEKATVIAEKREKSAVIEAAQGKTKKNKKKAETKTVEL